MSDQIAVGAVGWDHPGWCDRFYPDDLPPEWRLTYYGNEFLQVLVPETLWLGQPAGCVGWRDEVDGSFRFVFEISQAMADAEESLQSLEACAAALRSHLAGVVCWQPVPERAVAALRQVLGESRFVARPGVSEERLAIDGAVACARADSRQAVDLLWLRQLLEALQAHHSAGGHGWLFIEGSPPQIEVLRKAVILQQLLAGPGAGGG